MKIKIGVQAGDILAAVFMIIGGAFTAAAVVLAVNMDWVRTRGSGDTEMLPVVFGSIGIPMLAVGILFMILSIRKRVISARAVSGGQSVMATVAGIRQNYSIQVNGMSPYVLECHYRDPSSGVMHVFRSGNLYFYPAEMLGGRIKVYVDPEHMGHYYVDTTSLIPDVQIH
jgi:hypothetical protein